MKKQLKKTPIWITIKVAQLLRLLIPSTRKIDIELYNKLTKFIELKKRFGK